MKLDNYSYCHKLIRKTCNQLALLTETQLVTELGEEFDEIRFLDKFGYIVIDFKRNAVYTLGHKLNDLELKLVNDIIIYCDWLETGEQVKLMLKGGK